LGRQIAGLRWAGNGRPASGPAERKKEKNERRTKMKHESIIISGKDLWHNWESDNRSPVDVAGFEIEKEKYYRVSWPEHVLYPRLNGDCVIDGPIDGLS